MPVTRPATTSLLRSGSNSRTSVRGESAVLHEVDETSTVVCPQQRQREQQQQHDNCHYEQQQQYGSIQDCLKDIGHRAAALQRQLERSTATWAQQQQQQHAMTTAAQPSSPLSMLSTSSTAFRTSLWSLLCELRPLLLLASCEAAWSPTLSSSPSSSAQDTAMSRSIQRYRTGDTLRDVHHVRLAARLYAAVLRMTAALPAALLHGCVTLLTLLPTLADPAPSSSAHTTRFLDTLRFALCALHACDARVLSALLDALLRSDGSDGSSSGSSVADKDNDNNDYDDDDSALAAFVPLYNSNISSSVPSSSSTAMTTAAAFLPAWRASRYGVHCISLVAYVTAAASTSPLWSAAALSSSSAAQDTHAYVAGSEVYDDAMSTRTLRCLGDDSNSNSSVLPPPSTSAAAAAPQHQQQQPQMITSTSSSVAAGTAAAWASTGGATSAADLYSCVLAARNTYEVVCTAYGLLHVLQQLLQLLSDDALACALSPSRLDGLVRFVCDVLAAPLDALLLSPSSSSSSSSMFAWLQHKAQTAVPHTRKRPRDDAADAHTHEAIAAAQSVWHCGGALLLQLLQRGLLTAAHAPCVLLAVVRVLSHMTRTGVTIVVAASPAWHVHLLQWLTSAAATTRAATASMCAAYILEEVLQLLLDWSLATLPCIDSDDNDDGEGDCGVSDVEDMMRVRVWTLLLRLLVQCAHASTAPCDNDTSSDVDAAVQQRVQLAAQRVQLARRYLPRLLRCRPHVRWWLRHATCARRDGGACVLDALPRLLSLLPRAYVVASLQHAAEVALSACDGVNNNNNNNNNKSSYNNSSDAATAVARGAGAVIAANVLACLTYRTAVTAVRARCVARGVAYTNNGVDVNNNNCSEEDDKTDDVVGASDVPSRLAAAVDDVLTMWHTHVDSNNDTDTTTAQRLRERLLVALTTLLRSCAQLQSRTARSSSAWLLLTPQRVSDVVRVAASAAAAMATMTTAQQHAPSTATHDACALRALLVSTVYTCCAATTSAATTATTHCASTLLPMHDATHVKGDGDAVSLSRCIGVARGVQQRVHAAARAVMATASSSSSSSSGNNNNNNSSGSECAKTMMTAAHMHDGYATHVVHTSSCTSSTLSLMTTATATRSTEGNGSTSNSRCDSSAVVVGVMHELRALLASCSSSSALHSNVATDNNNNADAVTRSLVGELLLHALLVTLTDVQLHALLLPLLPSSSPPPPTPQHDSTRTTARHGLSTSMTNTVATATVTALHARDDGHACDPLSHNAATTNIASSLMDEQARLLALLVRLLQQQQQQQQQARRLPRALYTAAYRLLCVLAACVPHCHDADALLLSLQQQQQREEKDAQTLHGDMAGAHDEDIDDDEDEATATRAYVALAVSRKLGHNNSENDKGSSYSYVRQWTQALQLRQQREDSGDDVKDSDTTTTTACADAAPTSLQQQQQQQQLFVRWLHCMHMVFTHGWCSLYDNTDDNDDNDDDVNNNNGSSSSNDAALVAAARAMAVHGQDAAHTRWRREVCRFVCTCHNMCTRDAEAAVLCAPVALAALHSVNMTSEELCREGKDDNSGDDGGSDVAVLATGKATLLCALCALEGVDVRALVTHSLDVLLAPCVLLSSSSDATARRGGKLQQQSSVSSRRTVVQRGRVAVTDTADNNNNDNNEEAVPPPPQQQQLRCRHECLCALLGATELRSVGFAAMTAYVLYTYSDAPATRQLAALDMVMRYAHRPLTALPELMHHTLAAVVLHVLSLEADAQLAAAAAAAAAATTTHSAAPAAATGETSGDGGAPLDATAFARFTAALQRAAALRECAPSQSGVLQALRTPLSPAMASQAVARVAFDVLDSVSRRMCLRTLQQRHEQQQRQQQQQQQRGGNNSNNNDATTTTAAVAAAAAAPVMLPVVSTTALRRWLLGLASLVCFLGEHATMMAAKLSAMLDVCSSSSSSGDDDVSSTHVLYEVCVVWRALVYNCSDDYVRQHAPAMAVDLLSLELATRSVTSAALLPPPPPTTTTAAAAATTDTRVQVSMTLLYAAMTRLYDKTRQALFWQSYLHVLSQTNALIAHVKQLHERDAAAAAAGAEQQQQQGGHDNKTALLDVTGSHYVCCSSQTAATAHADVLVASFCAVMQSSSRKCKAVFVRALYDYLCHASVDARLAMTRAAAAAAPTLMTTLLRCARELHGEDEAAVQHVLCCVGMLGAVAPRSNNNSSVSVSAHDLVDAHSSTTVGAGGGYHLDMETVLHWSTLAQTLLGVYCTRALSNTADPVMHDRAAYAVQELLRIFANKERQRSDGIALRAEQVLSVDELQRYVWWSGLSAQSRQMLAGFTTTTYTTVVVQQTTRHSPAYRPGMPYATWLFALFCNVAAHCRGTFADVVAALRNVAKRDAVLMAFLLPYMLAHLLAREDDDDAGGDGDGGDAVVNNNKKKSAGGDNDDGRTSSSATALRDVALELQTVFAVATANLRDTKGNDDNDNDDAAASVATSSAHSSDAAAAHAVDEHVQYALHLLEDVEQLRWRLLLRAVTRRSREQHSSSSSSNNHHGSTTSATETTEQHCAKLAERYGRFVAMVSWRQRALAAMVVGSYMRALRVLEAQRRLPCVSDADNSNNNKDGKTVDDADDGNGTSASRLPLQRLFAALDDRDSAHSMHRRRTRHAATAAADAAASLESNGDWQLALHNCEGVLQHRPDSTAHQLIALRCMHKLGQLHLMSHYATSLLARAQQHAVHDGGNTTNGACDKNNSSSISSSCGVAAPTQSGTTTHACCQATLQLYANEAAWRLGEWERIHTSDNDGRGSTAAAATAATTALPVVSLAEPVVRCVSWLLHEHDRGVAVDDVAVCCAAQRMRLASLLRVACREGYAQAYSHVVHLHALADVELVTADVLASRRQQEQQRSPGSRHCRRSGGSNKDNGSNSSGGGGACALAFDISNTTESTANTTASTARGSGSADVCDDACRRRIAAALSRRLSYTDATLDAREPLLSLHRVLYGCLGMHAEAAETRLQHAMLLRQAGLHEAALCVARQVEYDNNNSSNNSSTRALPAHYYTLVAELLHDVHSPRHAIDFAQVQQRNTALPSAVRAHLQVLLTTWQVECGTQNPNEVIAAYEHALGLHASTAAHHQLGLFYDHLYSLHRNSADVTARRGVAPTTASLVEQQQQQQQQQPPSATMTHSVHADVVQWTRQYALKATQHYGQALLLGTDTLCVSLPRMLTLWLDSTATLASVCASSTNGGCSSNNNSNSVGGGSTVAVHAERVLRRMNALIENLLLGERGARIAPRLLVTALPQLLSRLGHTRGDVVAIVTRVVVDLMTHYPQPCLWMVLPIAFSKQKEREQVAKQRILAPFAALDKAYMTCLEHAFDLFTSLIELCNCPASTLTGTASNSNNSSSSGGNNNTSTRLTRQPFIQRIAAMLPTARLLLPIMHNLTPRVATATVTSAHHAPQALDNSSDKDNDDNDDDGGGGDANVFPTAPTFGRFDDRVEIMSSLQRPKRIWVHSNEGDCVSFLCKSKDEPRKDIRMMEVAGLMNTLFLCDADARRRRYSLRRYAIAALTDDCAIIEWVNNLSTLRSVVTQCYALDGSGVSLTRVKEWYAKVESKAMTRMSLLVDHILPAAPPVLHQWLVQRFADSAQWYAARRRFAQSTALWSIAGHVVGLGDRHGENVMLDGACGEVLHVDFACMFDKGEALEVPERVRFRLTQNLVDAMGVLGADGPFRADCVVTLRCLAANKHAVMSVIETLLHDPLVEWGERGRHAAATAHDSGKTTTAAAAVEGGGRRRGDGVDPRALIHRVSRRLDGFLDLYSRPREYDTLALNVEGQVAKLISHSSALENLSEMYIWWMAWI